MSVLQPPPDVRVIESLKLFSHKFKGRPKYWRLVTHRLPDETLFTVLYLPGGADSGLRDEAARRYWIDELGCDVSQPENEPLFEEIAS